MRARLNSMVALVPHALTSYFIETNSAGCELCLFGKHSLFGAASSFRFQIYHRCARKFEVIIS